MGPRVVVVRCHYFPESHGVLPDLLPARYLIVTKDVVRLPFGVLFVEVWREITCRFWRPFGRGINCRVWFLLQPPLVQSYLD